MSVKKRHFIRNSDLRELVEDLRPYFGGEIEDLLKGQVETGELESGERIILVDDEPLLVKKGEKFFPLIQNADSLSLKSIVVDMGAVKPITDGADVMAPGVVEVDGNIESGEIVCVRDEENKKIIAIGKSLEDGSSLTGEEGKVVENVHYVGDRFWSLLEKF